MADVTIKSFILWSSYQDDAVTPNFRMIASMLRDYVQENEVEVFYPKNLFIKNDIYAYVFGENNVQVITADETEMTINSLSYGQIIKVEMARSRGGRDDYRLSIEFSTGELILLNNVEDTNFSYRDTFRENIVNIFKLLTRGSID